MNILLQILDEGKVTDAHGRTVNFENTVIVMTSNAGSEKKGGSLGFAKSEQEANKEKAMKALSEFLRPEFLSRVDEVIVFRSLKDEDYQAIARLMLREYQDSLKERGIELSCDDAAFAWLSQHAAGGKSGARDLRNLIRHEIEDKIASALVEEQDAEIHAIHFSVDDSLKMRVI